MHVIFKTDEEFAQAIIDHKIYLNPKPETISSDIPLTLEGQSVERDELVYGHECTVYDTNAFGTVHGGIMMTIMDITMGVLCYFTGNGKPCPTMNMNFYFVKAANPGDKILCTAHIVSTTKNFVNTECRITCGENLIATGTATYRMYR